MLSTTGSPPFAAPVFTALPVEPHLIAAGTDDILHLNSDSLADIILELNNGDGTETLSAMLGQADGTFQRHDIATITGTIRDTQIADLRGTGRSDLIVYSEPTDSSSGDNIDIYLDNGDGTFTHTGPTISAAADATLTVMDMNGDHHPDLVLNESESVDVYLGDGTGGFNSAAHTDFGGHTISTLATDLNGDGIADAVLTFDDFTTDADNSIIEVHLGQPDGTFASAASFTSDAGQSTHFDRLDTFAGDTLPDMIAYEQPTFDNTPATFEVFHNLGGGAFRQSFSLDLPNGYLRSIAGDVNGDGKPDLVVFEGNFDSTSPTLAHVLIGGANATFTPGQTLPVPNIDPNALNLADSSDSPITLEDMNGDSSLDLVADTSTVVNGAASTSGIAFYFNDGHGTFATTPLTLTPTIANPDSASIGDVNGDGKPDVLFLGSDTNSPGIENNSVSMFVNKGNGTFGAEQATDFGANTEVEGFGDVATLTLTDFIVYQDVTTGTADSPTAPMADSFKSYRTNADGSLQAPSGTVTFGGEVSPFNLIVDFDGHGTPDLLVAGTSPIGVYVVLQSNTGPPPDNAGNTLATARDIGALSSPQVFNDAVGPQDTNDYYKFTVSQESIVTLTLTGLTANADLKLENLNGAAVATSSQTGTTDESITQDVTAGTYYIRVFPVGSASTNYTLTASAGAAPLPNLQGSFDAIRLGSAALTPSDVLIPGDKLTAIVAVSDDSPTPASASDLVVNLYASTKNTLDGTTEILLKSMDIAAFKVAANSSNDYSIAFAVPADILPGSYFLLAKVDASDQVAESNEDDNAAASAFTSQVALEAGQVGSQSNVTLNFQDPNGVPVTLSLTKGGTANVQFVTVGQTTAEDITITGTNSKSVFTLKTKANSSGDNLVTLHNVTVGTPAGQQSLAPAALSANAANADPNGASLKSFSAANGLLIGTFEADGTIQSIQIGEVSSGLIQIDPAPVGFKVAPLVLSFPINITNGSIDSAIPIKSLTAVDWTDTDATPDFLQAPSLGSLSITGNKKASIGGDFGADLTLTGTGNSTPTLGSVKIAGVLVGSIWNITGATGAIQISGGIAGNVAPVSITAASIKSLTVNSDVQNLALTLTEAFNAAQPKLQDLGKLQITDSVNNLTLASAGSVGTIATGDISGSSILIGVVNSPVGLPNTAADFVSAPGTVGPSLTSITVKNNFVASDIAAPQIGAVTLPALTTNPDDPAFGVAAELVKSAKINGVKDVDANKDHSVDPLTIDNFDLEIL